jgi:hypothetical protein
MEKRYQIELDRNERDLATFFKRRKISLSQNQFRVLIAARAAKDHISTFETENFIKKLTERNSSPYNGLKNELRSRLKA